MEDAAHDMHASRAQSGGMHSPPGMSTAGSDGAVPPPPPSFDGAPPVKAYKRASNGSMVGEAAERPHPPKCAPPFLLAERAEKRVLM